MHDAGNLDIHGLNNKMNRVDHQAEGVHLVAKVFGPFLEQDIEAIVGLILEEDALFAVTTIVFLVDGAGSMYAGFAGHGETIPLKSPNANHDPHFLCGRSRDLKFG